MYRPVLAVAFAATLATGLSGCGKKVAEMPAAPAPETPIAPPADGMDAVPPADGSMPETPPVIPPPPSEPNATSPATSTEAPPT